MSQPGPSKRIVVGNLHLRVDATGYVNICDTRAPERRVLTDCNKLGEAVRQMEAYLSERRS